LSKLFDPVPVLKDQGFLLGPRPAFQLPFGSQSLFPCRELLNEHEAEWTPSLGVSRDLASVMLG